jgi:hypothetical protein
LARKIKLFEGQRFDYTNTLIFWSKIIFAYFPASYDVRSIKTFPYNEIHAWVDLIVRNPKNQRSHSILILETKEQSRESRYSTHLDEVCYNNTHFASKSMLLFQYHMHHSHRAQASSSTKCKQQEQAHRCNQRATMAPALIAMRRKYWPESEMCTLCEQLIVQSACN